MLTSWKKLDITFITLAVILVMSEQSPSNAMRRTAKFTGALFDSSIVKRPLLAKRFDLSVVKSSLFAKRHYTLTEPVPIKETKGYTPPKKTQDQLNKQSFHRLPEKKVLYLDKEREHFIEIEEASSTESLLPSSIVPKSSMTEDGDTIIFNFEKKK